MPYEIDPEDERIFRLLEGDRIGTLPSEASGPAFVSGETTAFSGREKELDLTGIIIRQTSFDHHQSLRMQKR